MKKYEIGTFMIFEVVFNSSNLFSTLYRSNLPKRIRITNQ